MLKVPDTRTGKIAVSAAAIGVIWIARSFLKRQVPRSDGFSAGFSAGNFSASNFSGSADTWPPVMHAPQTPASGD